MEFVESEYDCIRCFEKIQAKNPGVMVMRRMIGCVECGNKRCPKATDHTLVCTRSNESGQQGSDY